MVLGGWAFNVPALTYIRSTFVSMKANAALSFLCLGVGLCLAQNDEWQRARRILGLSVVVIAGLTLAEYGFRVKLGIDQLFFHDARIPLLSAYPGRMAIATATCFLLLGLAVALLGTKKAIALRHTLVAPCFAFSIVALCGYLYGTKSLYSITSFSIVGLHTAAGLFAACLAYFLARPDEGIVSIVASDTNSGLLLRTLFPAIIVVPILMGWLRLQGQRANLYNTQFGVALQVLVSIGCLTALTVLVARSMQRLEWERFRSEAARIRYAAIVESSEDAILSATLDGIIETWNPGAQRMLGYTENEVVGKPVTILVPPELPDEINNLLATLSAGGCIEQFETVRVSKAGKRIDVSLSIFPIKDSAGKTVGYAGIERDITKRKRVEEALSEMSRKFTAAQEQERSRIGRELHDDISQRFALLSVQLDQLQQSPTEFQSRMQELRNELHQISNDMDAIAHDLHSSRMEYLGAIAGMKSWCKEVADRRKIEIAFRSDYSGNLPLDVGLPLFRVLQEAVNNAIKHSGEKRIEVQLREHSGEIDLIVGDSGKGFDVETALRGKGLGLTSMRERVRLVNGTIAIESRPTGGTNIHVRVQLEPSSNVERLSA